MKITQNRKYAFFIGIVVTIGGWFGLLLMTQDKDINITKDIARTITKDQYIGLGFAIVSYILWWFKFCYTVEAK